MKFSRGLRLTAVCVGIALLLTACGGSGSGSSSSNTFFEPFSSHTGSKYAGLWLIDAGNPSGTPIQITSAGVDVPDFGTGPTFYDWNYDPSSGKRNKMQLQFFAYGSGGHIFGVSLTQPGAARQLSSGTYSTLCSAIAVQTGPFSTSKSYVVAQVALNGTSCNTTWIIPTDASSTDTPTTPAQVVTFITGMKDTATGLVTGFLVQAGSELDVYSTEMTKVSTSVASLPSGSRVLLASSYSYISPTQGVIVETGTQGVTSVQDDVYLVDSKNATLVGSYTLPASTSCGANPQFSFVSGAMTSSSLLYIVRDPSGGAGFTVESVPLAGGTPTTIYSNTTGCGSPFVDGISDGRMLIDDFNIGSNLNETISISVTGPAGQTPVTLETFDIINNFAFVNYAIGSNAWVNDFSLDPISGVITDVTAHVVDLSSGNILMSYAHSYIDGDFWNGFNADGSIARGPLFIATGSSVPGCSLQISSFTSIDPTNFASDTIPVDGAPCRGLLVGPAPLATGSLGTSFYYLSKTASADLSFGKVALSAPNGGTFSSVFGSPIY